MASFFVSEWELFTVRQEISSLFERAYLSRPASEDTPTLEGIGNALIDLDLSSPIHPRP